MIDLIIILGLMVLFFIVIAFKLEDKHQVIKVLSLFFSIYFILLLGKTAIDTRQVCKVLLTNETASGNLTTYNYDYLCFSNPNIENTTTTAYKLSLWFFRLIIVYTFVFILYSVYQYYDKLQKLKK